MLTSFALAAGCALPRWRVALEEAAAVAAGSAWVASGGAAWDLRTPARFQNLLKTFQDAV